jgi:hypothetical protein
MKAKEFIPISKPRNFVVKNQKTAGAGAHKDKKRAEKQGDVKHKQKQFEQGMAEDAVADFLARGGEIQHGKFRKPRKSEKTDYGSKHIGGQRDAVAGKAGKTLGKAAATNFKGGGKPVVGPTYRSEGVAEGWDDEEDEEKIVLIKSLKWPELVNKVNSAMKAMGWKGQRKDDGSFMFSTRGQLDDEWYIVVIDNRGNNMFTYALGTVEEGDPHIGDQESLPMTEASVSELMNAIREGFGLGESSVSEVSKDTLDRYVSKASDAHGDADFKARMSKHDPDKRSYHVDQKKTAEKRRQGISRALDRMSRQESVEEGDNDWSGSQGNFAGDKPFNLGSDVAKRLDVNDTVSYFGEKATILAMSKDRTVSRIDLKSGITQNVKTSDLKRVGQGMGEATSVAVRMQRAADKQRAKSDASLARTPSSIPKKEEPKKS